MLHEGFKAHWSDGLRGKAIALGLVVLVALASVLGSIEEWRHRRSR